MTLAMQLDAATRYATAVHPRLVEAERMMSAIYAQGWPTGRGGGGSTSDITDTVSAACIRNTTGTGTGYLVADHHDLILNNIRTIAELLHEIDRTCAQYTRLLHPTIPRCTADPNLPGYHGGNWHRPDCENIPGSRLGLCDACYQRHRRWAISAGVWRGDAA